jgi:hypothetical protein
VLSANLLTIEPTRIREVRTDCTIIGGEVVSERRSG